MKYRFLRWWLIICLTGVGLFFLCWNGGVDYVNKADFTKISFLIFALFVYASARIGWHCRGGSCSFDDAWPSKYICRELPKLGLIGTLVGMSKMLLAFSGGNINFQDPLQSQQVISNMALGMSTALITTIAGLVFSRILRLEIFNYDYK